MKEEHFGNVISRDKNKDDLFGLDQKLESEFLETIGRWGWLKF